jgi:hypothetical protein
MKCTNCQKDLPENYGGVRCPLCGTDLPSAAAGLPDDNSVEPRRLNAKLFLLAFVGPPLLTLLSAWLFRTKNGGVPVMFGLIGGILGGITSGVMIGMQTAKSLAGRIFLTFIFGAIMVVAIITLCFFGCALGGYQFNLR